jgi:secondary thiamine-phosphate synthase enzyme
VETTRAPGFFDITAEVEAAVRAANVRDGIVVIFSRHTTAAVRINENEPLLIADMEDFLRRIAPADATYRHNDFDVRTNNMADDESPNGHSHCLSLFLTSSETIPIENGRLLMGTWQRVFLVELDRPRRRDLLLKIIEG